MTSRRIVHIEISAKDREKAADFYNRTFDWQIKHFPDMNYATFAAGEGPGGGFNPVGDGNPAGTVLIYLESEDITGDLEKIKKNGGKEIIPRTEIPGVGFYAIFEDPTGNRLGLLNYLPAAAP